VALNDGIIEYNIINFHSDDSVVIRLDILSWPVSGAISPLYLCYSGPATHCDVKNVLIEALYERLHGDELELGRT
jgi:hypothetical protein